MKARLIVRLAAAALIVTAASAVAQGQSVQPSQRSEKAVKLTMEQRHIVKEIILKELKVEPQKADIPTGIGEQVPAGIPLQPIPVEVSAKVPLLKTHSYVVKNDAVVIVDPKDNRIAALVD